MFGKIIKRLTGVEAIEAARAEAERLKAEAEAAAVEAVKEAAKAKAEAEEAKRQEELAKQSPKDRATAQGMPYVAVLDTHVNKDNIRNGFFELDWNEFFIKDLVEAGYGTEEDPEEEVVDRWFRELCGNILEEEGIQGQRYGGYINVTPIEKGKSEVS